VGDLFKATQTRPIATQTDPFTNLRPQQQVAEAYLGGQMGRDRSGEIGNPYVGPSARQTGALDALQGYLGQATPAFNQGARLLEQTAAGAYLDPTKTEQYQRLKTSQMNLGNMLFRDTAGDLADRSRNYYSSARRLQQVKAGGEIAGNIGQKVAGAGWGQYGAERGMQEAAAAKGMTLAPGLANQVFGAEEALRSGQQRGNIDQMQGQLASMGLDQQKSNALLQYLGTAAGVPVPYVKGPSWMDRISTSLSNWGPSMGKSGQNPSTSTYDPNSWSGSKSSGYWV
jgi:hypothetical protein